MDRLNNQKAVMERLSCSRTTLYYLFREGHLRYVTLGTKRLVPDSELERFINDRLGNDEGVPLLSKAQ